MFLLGKTEKKAKNLKHIERKRNKSNAMNIAVLTKKQNVHLFILDDFVQYINQGCRFLQKKIYLILISYFFNKNIF